MKINDALSYFFNVFLSLYNVMYIFHTVYIIIYYIILKSNEEFKELNNSKYYYINYSIH